MLPSGTFPARAAAAGRLEEALAELLPKNRDDFVELANREPTPAQVTKHEQLEQIDRRVPSLRVSPGGRAMRPDGRRQLQLWDASGLLPRAQTAHGCHLARGIRLLQLHREVDRRTWSGSTTPA